VTLDPAHRLRLLVDLGRAFAERLELDELVPLVLSGCCDALDAEAASVLLLDPDRQELYFPYVSGDDSAADELRTLRFPADRGIAGAVLASGAPVRVDDTHTDPRFYGGVDRRTGHTTRAIVCAPLVTRQGRIGVVQVLNPRRTAAFTDDDLDLLAALAGSVAVAIENARIYAQLRAQVRTLEDAVRQREELLAIRRELDAARVIQQSMLPSTSSALRERTDLDLHATMLPASEVGGDFYDYFFIDAHRLALVVGDVSGKGVPAAIFMAMSRMLLKATALQDHDPAHCIATVNTMLGRDNAADMFVTLFYAVLDTRTGHVAYTNAGHNPPYVLRADGVERLAGTGTAVLGMLEDVQPRTAATHLAGGEALVLYSDGVTDALDAHLTLFGEERLRTVLGAHRTAAAATTVAAVVTAVREHAGAAPQFDDVTVLCVRRGAWGPEGLGA